MKIVVLDGHTLNPGDLSWAGLAVLGPLRVYDRTAPGEVVARAADAEIVLTNKTVLDAATIRALPVLRYIGVLATGYNVVDIDEARVEGIPVTNVPGYSTPSVAQLTFALLLELTHRVGAHSQGVRQGDWCRKPDFCYWDSPLTELAGLTLGLIGYGQVGQAVARIGQAFGLSVLVHTRTPPPIHGPGIEFTELVPLLQHSHIVSLHCPLTPDTTRFINRERLLHMKPGALLLNTGRGGLVDEAALAEALNSGHLAGAGLDVLSTEPPAPDNPLLSARNCVITPHLGWATRAARERLLNHAVENVAAFLTGRPRNVVNARPAD